MDLPVTLGLIVAGALAAVFCGWMGAKPKDYSKPRRIPWQMLMLISAFVCLILAVHLINLFGVTTGQNR
jgi:hypothetical protein